MLKRLISILTGGEGPYDEAADRFARMMELAQEMILEASAVYWGKQQTPEERTALYEKDKQVNKLERAIRRDIVAQLCGPVPHDVPYGLLMMSLVKDVERLGDYAKNLAEVPAITKQSLPEDETVGELREISRSVETLAREAPQVYAASDAERANELTVEGRSLQKRCDRLIPKIASGSHPASVAVALTLATRFYKRMGGHLLNLLSSMLMPLHKLDYYDEKSLTTQE